MISRLRFLPVLALTLSGLAHAAVIDKGLTVNVYRLCDNGGSNCASLGPSGNSYFETEVNKIWAQAGVQVFFNFVQNINSTAFSYIDDGVSGDGFADLALAYGTPGYFSSTSIDMYLVHTVAGAYGEGWFGQGGLVIAMDTVMSYSAAGRLDTIAHEIGHNLGLVPSGAGGDAGGHSGSANHLMASGGIRSIPTSVADIAPDGNGWDLLPSNQIAIARTSSLLYDIVQTPEPTTLVLLGSGLVIVGLRRRRKI